MAEENEFAEQIGTNDIVACQHINDNVNELK